MNLCDAADVSLPAVHTEPDPLVCAAIDQCLHDVVPAPDKGAESTCTSDAVSGAVMATMMDAVIDGVRMQ